MVEKSLDNAKHQQPEDTLRHSEAFFLRLSACCPVAIFTTDKSGQCTYTNPRFQSICGSTVEQSLGEGWARFVHPDDRESVLEEWSARARSGSEFSFKFRLVTAQGLIRWVKVRSSPLFNERGRFAGRVNTVEDITERKQIEQALRLSEERFRVALKSVPLVLAHMDRDLRFTWVANTPPEFLPEEVIGKKDNEIFPPEVAEPFVRLKRSVLESGVGCRQEVLVEVGGHKRAYDMTLEPLRDETGAIVGLTEVALDITERKQAQESTRQLATQIQEQANVLNAILSTSADHIYIFDRAGRYQYVSHGGATVLGLKPEDCVGKTWRELGLPTDIMEQVDVQREAVMATGQPIKQECEYIALNGLHYFEYILTPLQRLDRTIEGVIVVSRDITDRKRAEQGLRESEQRLRLAQRAAKIGTWEWNVLTGEISWSEGIWELLGLEQGSEELGVKPWEDFIHPSDRERVMHSVKNVFAQGEDYYDEFRIVRRDGTISWVASKGRVIRNTDGEPVRMLGVNIDISDRKQVEDALRESEQRYRSLVKASSQIVWTANERGQYVEIQGWEEFTGQPAQELLIQGSREAIHSDDLEWVTQAWWNAVATKSSFDVEHRIRKYDGTYEYFAVRGVPVFDAEGKVLAWVGMSTNINARKQAEAALRESERRYRSIFDTATVSIWEQDFSAVKLLIDELKAQGITDMRAYLDEHPEVVFQAVEMVRIIDVNEQTLKLFQAQSKDELLSSLSSIFIPETTRVFQEEMLAIAQGKRSLSSEAQLRTLQGDRIDVLFTMSLPEPETPFNSVLVCLMDISDRKRAEEEREQLLAREQAARFEAETERRRLRDILMQLPAMIGIVQGPDLIYEFANPTYLEVTGRSSDIIGKSIGDVFPELEGQSYFETLDRIYKTGEPFIKDESPVYWDRNGDGLKEQAFFNCVFPPLRDAQGQIQGVLIHAIEVTDQVRARQQIEELLTREQAARAEAEAANRTKDQFLAILSHELRTPINPILGWSKLLRSGKLDENKSIKALETIERNANLQAQLIEDLLDISRILEGKLCLNACPLNLSATIEAAIDTVRLSAQTKGIQIECIMAPDVGQVFADSSRLQQVVWNVLSNAVKFTPQGGRVEVRLERIGTDAQITVSDNGKGISADFLPFVFESFRQADGSTTRKYGGLGLGLSIARHLVELHGGSIQAESAGEGKGATFTVRLPLMLSQSETTKNSEQSQASPDLTGVRVLVVDDEPDTLELIAFILEEHGAEVIALASAAEALQVLRQSKPHVLLSDIGMPEMDGYMLMRQVRALEPDQGGEIPAIALTAYAGEFDEQQALKAGFTRHISKPVELVELVAAIAFLIGR